MPMTKKLNINCPVAGTAMILPQIIFGELSIMFKESFHIFIINQ